MKTTLLSLATVTLALAFAVRAHGQSQSWNGGDGTWDAGTTPNWSSGTWTNGNQAVFESTPGTIDVASGVTNDQMYFSAPAGDWVFNGADLTDTQGGNFAVYADANNASNITINNNISLSYNPSNNLQGFQNYGSGTLTLNGNISLSGAPVGGAAQQYYFDAGTVGANGAGSIVINGSVSTTNAGAEADFGFHGGALNAQYVFGPNANFSGMPSINAANGTFLLQTSNVGQQITLEYGTSNVLTSGAINYSGALYERVDGTSVTIGGATADASSFSGTLQVDNAGLLGVTAATGGRVTLDNSISGELGGDGLVITGNGTVVINGSSGGSLGTGMSYGISGTVAADLKSGTTLITNKLGQGSAFGSSTGNVIVESGATLGGSGDSTQAVIANAGAIIAPGDAGQTNLGINPSIGTLTLSGLNATNGVTFAFKLAGTGTSPGTDSDYLNVSGLALGNSTVNIDISVFGSEPLLTGQIYTLMTGTNWSGNPDFSFTLPTGYALDTDDPLLGFQGYSFDATGGSFGIELVAVPEPSTYALLGLGLVGLIAIRRFRSLRA